MLAASFAKLELRPGDVRGIRAPFLGTGPGFFQALADRKMTYDTSVTRGADYWPTKQPNGVWDIPLAAIRVPMGKGLPNEGNLVNSSDVGFYDLQRNTQARPRNAAATNTTRYDEMLATYRAYFAQSYYGNRAPLRLAHHFTQYWAEKATDESGDGKLDHVAPYLEAVEDFEAEVCSMPEVKCVTFGELATYLAANADKLKGFQKGQFEKLAPAPGMKTQSFATDDARATVRDEVGGDEFPAITDIPGADEACEEGHTH